MVIIRLIRNIDDMENRSMYVAFTNGKKVWLPENIIEKLI
jgi:hypothetical protein